MITQGQLNGFPTLDAFDHLLDHIVRQGEAEEFRDVSINLRAGRWERSQRQAGLWDDESGHLVWLFAERVVGVVRGCGGCREVVLSCEVTTLSDVGGTMST
jgi:hypothetical protein